MAAVLRVINFYERDNIGLPRVFNRQLPWEDFSDGERLNARDLAENHWVMFRHCFRTSISVRFSQLLIWEVIVSHNFCSLAFGKVSSNKGPSYVKLI